MKTENLFTRCHNMEVISELSQDSVRGVVGQKHHWSTFMRGWEENLQRVSINKSYKDISVKGRREWGSS